MSRSTLIANHPVRVAVARTGVNPTLIVQRGKGWLKCREEGVCRMCRRPASIRPLTRHHVVRRVCDCSALVVLTDPVAAAAYLAGLVDGEGGVYVWRKQNKALIRITMTDREPLEAAAVACRTLAIETMGVRERGFTKKGRAIFVVEIARARSIIRAAEVLDLCVPAKRDRLDEAAEYRRGTLRRYEPRPCSKCGRDAKPLRRGLCNRCRLRERKAS